MDDDMIYRQAAIDRFEPWLKVKGYNEGELNMLKAVLYELKCLPSAQTERKTGRWREVYAETDYRNGWIEFTCECCEYQHGLESGEYGWHYGDEIPWKFCPVCGAEMKGENDG